MANEIKRCPHLTRRGGFTAGGGYDRMNFTRYEACGRPLPEGKRLCARHEKADERMTRKIAMRHEARLAADHRAGRHINPSDWPGCILCHGEGR